MTHPSSPRGVRVGGGAVSLGAVLLFLLTTLVAAPAAADTPTPVPAGAGASKVSPTPAAPSTSYAVRPEEFSLMIIPTRLVLSPADVGTQQISVVNQDRMAVSVTVQKRNFTTARDGSLRYDQNSPYGPIDGYG